MKRSFEYEPNEFWVVQTERRIAAGNYTLQLEFTGNLTRSITGLYRSVYTNGDTGQKRSVHTRLYHSVYANEDSGQKRSVHTGQEGPCTTARKGQFILGGKILFVRDSVLP